MERNEQCRETSAACTSAHGFNSCHWRRRRVYDAGADDVGL